MCCTLFAIIHISLLISHNHAFWGLISIVGAAVAWAVHFTIRIERRRAARADAFEAADALQAEVTNIRSH